MIFAKPPEGFTWVELEEAKKQISKFLSDNEDMHDWWNLLKAELSMHGAELGRKHENGKAGFFTLSLNEPVKIKIYYQLTGDRIRVHELITDAK